MLPQAALAHGTESKPLVRSFLRQAKERLLLSLSQRLVHAAIKASFTRWNRVLKIVRKEYCEAQISGHCPEVELKRDTKI